MRKEILAIVGTLLLIHATMYHADARARSAFYEPGGVLLYAPKPEYPFEARGHGKTGSGIALVEVDPTSGRVTHIEMLQSTGNEVLDRSALAAFRQWRFKPGTPSPVQLPVTFGQGGQVTFQTRVKKSASMSEILAPILGKGTVLEGPNPTYPSSPPWTDKQGKGVYELHVGKDGKVEDVKVLKSSGDATFDRITVSTLRKWRLRKGPLIVELPLGFRMTSSTYDVYIP